MTAATIGMICVMTVMPGSSTAAILDTTWAYGRRLGFVTALGGSFGVALYSLLALLVGALLSNDGLWVTILEGAGAVYLAALGVASLVEAFSVTAGECQDSRTSQAGRAFVTGLLTTCLSPKVALFYLVYLSQHDFQAGTLTLGILSAGLFHVILRLVWYGVWIHLIQPMRRTLDGPWMQRSVKLMTGAFLMVLSFYIVL